MNETYREALDVLLAAESELDNLESLFSSAFDALNEAKNYITKFSGFRLNFNEATEFLNRSDRALHDREYQEAKELAGRALAAAEIVVEASMPEVVVEMEVDNVFKAGMRQKFDFSVRNKGNVEAKNIVLEFGGSIELQSSIDDIPRLGPKESRTITAVGLFRDPGDNQIKVNIEAYNEIEDTTITNTFDRWIKVKDKTGKQVTYTEEETGTLGNILIDRQLTEGVQYYEYVVTVENRTNKIIPRASITLKYDDSQIIARDTTTRDAISDKEFKLKDIEPGEKQTYKVFFDIAKQGAHKISGHLIYEMMVERGGVQTKERQFKEIQPITIEETPIITDYESYNDLIKKKTHSLIAIREKLLEMGMLAEFNGTVNMPQGVLPEDVIKYFFESIESHKLEKRELRDDHTMLDVWYFGLHMQYLIGLHLEVDKSLRIMKFHYFSDNWDSMEHLKGLIEKDFNKVLESKGAKNIVYVEGDYIEEGGSKVHIQDSVVQRSNIGGGGGKGGKTTISGSVVQRSDIAGGGDVEVDESVMVRSSVGGGGDGDGDMEYADGDDWDEEDDYGDEGEWLDEEDGGSGEPNELDIENYLGLLRQVWGDGVLLPFEKRAIEAAKEEYGISDELHGELQGRVRKELGLGDDGEVWA